MGSFWDNIKKLGGNRTDWDEESWDWDEELSEDELEAVDLDVNYDEGDYPEEAEEYENGFTYEDGTIYEDEGICEEDAVVYGESTVYEDGTVVCEEDAAVYGESTVYEDGTVVCEEDAVVYGESTVYEDGTVVYEEPEMVYVDNPENYEADDIYEVHEAYETYAEDILYDEDGIFEEDAVSDEDADLYSDDLIYEDSYDEDVVYEEDLYADDYYEESDKAPVFGFFGSISFDKIMMAAGVGVLVMAVITLVVFMTNRGQKDYSEVFASVGTQVAGIDIVGDQGLLALGDSIQNNVAEPEQPVPEKDYGEADYNKNVTVALKTASVQKDLKVKFVNNKSQKLIANVPFTLSVINPDGKTETWSDDDMDGIIHKKGITPGSYQLNVNALSGDKYNGYAVPGNTVKAEVKKDIAYEKVDVSGEVKTEAQIDTSKEEQKKPVVQEESKLTDTVEWVESTSVVSTYVEVAKNQITDPMTVAHSGTFARMASGVKLDRESVELKLGGESVALKAIHTEIPEGGNAVWDSSDSEVVFVDGAGVLTPQSEGTATITYILAVMQGEEEVKYTASCTVTVVPNVPSVTFNGSIAVNTASLNLTKGTTGSAQAAISGFEAGKAVTYSVSSANTDVATATVNESGAVTVTAVAPGTAVLTVSANYAESPVAQAPSAQITVTVSANLSVSLDKKEATVYAENKLTLTAATEDGAELTAESSDTGVATVAVEGKSVVITGVKAGTATITVTAKKGTEKVTAACAITVKAHPKNDTTTKLKDNQGNQLFVQEGNEYREAVYADYYRDDVKFFKKGDAKYTGWQTIDGKVYFFDKQGNKVTGEQVIQGAKYNFDSDGILMTGSGVMGIDVSKHNGNIDWKAVKNSGVSYVIIRCGYRGYTQGSLVIDSKFEQNIKGATDAGLKVGVYFFSQAVDEVEAVEEASFVLDAVKKYKISYPIFLDVEYSGASGNKGRADKLSLSERTAVCKAFCETIRSGGYTAGVYANKTWLESMIDPGQLGSHKIWLAQYAAAPTYTGRYDMWQYKCTGKVSGINGNVDMNLSYLGY